MRRKRIQVWLRLFLSIGRLSPMRAATVAYWYFTGRKVRARHRLRQAATELLPVYSTWIDFVESSECLEMRTAQTLHEGYDEIIFSLLVDVSVWTSATTLEKTLASIRRQLCPAWELICIGGQNSHLMREFPEGRFVAIERTEACPLDTALSTASGRYLLVVPADAMLPPWAIARYFAAARENPGSTLLFGDEDTIDNRGRRSNPWLKPEWDEELAMAKDYVSHASVISVAKARAANGAIPAGKDCSAYALLLRIMATDDLNVTHIPHIMCHMRSDAAVSTIEAHLRAVSTYVNKYGGTAAEGPFGTIRIEWPLPDPVPPVTIIVPTRDRIDLLDDCITSLLEETRYADYDVLIIDNGSEEPASHAWFKTLSGHPQVTIVRYDHPYNYSAINNFAVAQARGEYICLLNNDTEICDGAWLSQLMRYAVRSEIGAVGAKLLYEDGSIQHAGVVLGIGNAAGHAHRGLPNEAEGYFGVAHVPHYASAVTAACLVVSRAKFEAVGGLDEAGLAIAYNDVDLCLKLQKAGWRNVYAPQAVVVHHESKSRGLDMHPKNLARYMQELTIFKDRWATDNIVDPMHHPRLDRSSEIFRLSI